MGLKGGLLGGGNLTLSGSTGSRHLLVGNSCNRLLLGQTSTSQVFGLPGGFAPGAAYVPAIKAGGIGGRSVAGSTTAPFTLIGVGQMTVTAAGSASGTMSAILSAYRTMSAAGVATTTASAIGRGNIIASVRIGADPSADDIAQAVWNGTNVEGTMSMRNLMRIMGAALAGEVSIVGTTVTFRNILDTKDRITATVDGSNQRTSVTLDGS